MLRAELVRATDPAWDDRLEAVPRDIYHTAGFHHCAELAGEGDAYLAVVGDRDRGLAWPYLRRRVGEVPGLGWSTALDATSVYGYPGPLAWGCAPGDDFLQAAWSELLGIWRDQRVVSLFTRFHPLLRNDALAAGFRVPQRLAEPVEAVTPIGFTVSIDCTLDDMTARSGYDKQVRKASVRRRRDGYVTVHDEAWAHYDAFRTLYRATMTHNNAAAYYYFDDAHFERLRAALPGHVHLLVTQCDDAVVAAGVVLEYGGIVQTYLSAHDRQVRPSPKPLFYDDLRRWARARGNSVLHLGGGRGSKDDSLLEFKGRFSQRRHPFAIGRWILDPEAVRDLERAHAAALGPGQRVDAGFFPAYRSAMGRAGAADGPR